MTAPDATFKDYFSAQSADYRKFRPSYPDELFAYLAGIAPARDCAWDCATGSGQAAIGLARHFQQVIATDASGSQLAQAMTVPNIDYRLAPAEQSGIAAGSIDLVTVAQALHWFDCAAFYREAGRVLKEAGVIAIWSYNLLGVSPDIDRVIRHLYAELLGPYWPEERRLIESGYRGIPFPFHVIDCPAFTLRTQWALRELVGYLMTWSAVQNYIRANDRNPVQAILPDLQSAWGDATATRPIVWPLNLMVGCQRRPPA
jgi:SAM-dependent methyltransferase